MIEEIEIADLDPRQIKQLEGADRAIAKDPNYSIDIYSAILKQSPMEMLKIRYEHENERDRCLCL
jgi:hypothetical protein